MKGHNYDLFDYFLLIFNQSINNNSIGRFPPINY